MCAILRKCKEGCLGETLAVLHAAERLAVAQEPAVRAVLERIVEDETRHAALAWRTLAWALERDPALAGRVERVLAEERVKSGRFAPGWARVIEPTWAALRPEA